MRLSIVTINYNGAKKTLKLLKSLWEQTDQDFQIIVVDNASEEADFDNLKQNISNTVLIRNDDNFGFSWGNNVGIKKAIQNGASWVVLLNNDTWVEKDFISRLKPILSQKSGIVGLPLDEGDRVAYCGKIQWFRSTLKHIHNMLNIGCLTYAIGGAVAIHKDVFEKIGLWDEKYFLYFEDADFSLRARKVGIPISFTQEVMIYHNSSSTTKKLGSPLLLRYHYRNALYFNLKNGPWYIKIAVWFWSFWIIKRQVFKIIVRYKPEESHAILTGVFDFYHHGMGKIV